MKVPLDLTLYLIADAALCAERPLEQIVYDAIQGGVTCVQFRDKDSSDHEFQAIASALKAITHAEGVALILNDRAHLVHQVGAQGVHLGQSDMSVAEARTLLGDNAYVGLSVDEVERIKETWGLAVDYLGIGAVFSTRTKLDAGVPIGLQGLQTACRGAMHPVVAIGGINSSNAAACIQAGAAGVAVASAICLSEDPTHAAAGIGEALSKARFR